MEAVSGHTVSMGTTVVCCVNGEKYYIKKVSEISNLQLNRKQVPLSLFVGKPYGRVWRVQGDSTLVETKEGDDLRVASMGEIKKTNKDIYDDNVAQKLTQGDIERMKEKGVDGAEIVKQLTQNSTTFDDKTEFAKKKYIKKKKEKYCSTVKFMRPTGFNIATAMFSKGASKIGHLRPDAIAQILTHGNVHYGSKVLLVECSNGLLTGCVLEKMGGSGRIIRMYSGGCKTTGLGTMSHFPFSKTQLEVIRSIPFSVLKTTRPPALAGAMDADIDQSRLTEEQKQLYEGADSLIIATDDSVKELTVALLPFLKSSGAFVVYCHYTEPLAQLYDEFKKRKVATNISLTETWLRRYQVLSGTRTITNTEGCESSPVKKKPRTKQSDDAKE